MVALFLLFGHGLLAARQKERVLSCQIKETADGRRAPAAHAYLRNAELSPTSLSGFPRCWVTGGVGQRASASASGGPQMLSHAALDPGPEPWPPS